MRENARQVRGVSSGRRKANKETWWWNNEVQKSLTNKRLAQKSLDRQGDQESRQIYKEMKSRAKREVAKARAKAYEDLYLNLDTKEGEKDLYRLARVRDQAGKDVQQVGVIKDAGGNVLTNGERMRN